MEEARLCCVALMKRQEKQDWVVLFSLLIQLLLRGRRSKIVLCCECDGETEEAQCGCVKAVMKKHLKQDWVVLFTLLIQLSGKESKIVVCCDCD